MSNIREEGRKAGYYHLPKTHHLVGLEAQEWAEAYYQGQLARLTEDVDRATALVRAFAHLNSVLARP